MLVNEIMSKEVVCVNTVDSVLTTAKLMKEYNIGVIPVVEDKNKVLGLITDRDIVLWLAEHEEFGIRAEAKELMSQNVYSVKPDADITDAIELMKKMQIRRLPVLEEDKLVGMLSIGDIAVHLDNKIEISEAITEISMPQK